MSTSDNPPRKHERTLEERIAAARARIRPFISKEEGERMLQELLEERRAEARRE